MEDPNLLVVIDKGLDFANKTLECAQELGHFFGPMCKEPFSVVSEIITNELKFFSSKRQQRHMLQTKKFMEERGLAEPTRAVPLKFMIPLLRAASMEGDDELQDIWARLLVNAMDADSGVDLRRAYIDILENLTSMDAKFLSMLYEKSLHSVEKIFVTYGLPDDFLVQKSPVPHEEQRNPEAVSEGRKLKSDNILISLLNLERLGCIADAAVWKEAGGTLELVSITPLGVALIKACTFREMETVND